MLICGRIARCGTPAFPSPSLSHTPPACNVTIHNRCKDTLANCTKVKQKVRWQGGWRACGEGSATPAGLPTRSSPCVPLLTMGHPRPSAYVNKALPHEFTHPDAPNCRVSFLPRGQLPPDPGLSLGDSWFLLCVSLSPFCSVSHSNRKLLC